MFDHVQINAVTAEQLRAVMLGHAVADALGVPVEFSSRGALERAPVIGMRGYGTHGQPAGTWSDDTSMALCALAVLARGYCDLDEIMRNFGVWYSDGAYTATGECFDCGITCSRAIRRYYETECAAAACGPDDERSNGNGSLMRIHPFVLYLLARDGALSDEGFELIFKASAMTHGHRRSLLGCAVYACVLAALLDARGEAHPAEAVARGLAVARERFARDPEWETYGRLLGPGFATLAADDIRSSGYIVDTLEAALWCLLSTADYRDCVLRAVNLGEDTDTVGAVAGGLAGAFYGETAIPADWLDTLLLRDSIAELCDRAAETWARPSESGLTDLHVHLVPGVDDGASSPEMAMEMLGRMRAEGARRIYCTSHSHAGEAARERYETRFRALCDAAERAYPEMDLRPGCEILCSNIPVERVTERILSGEYRALGNSRCVLVEFNSRETAEHIREVAEAILGIGYLPVIAHAERCTAFDDTDFAASLITSCAAIQINAYSLVEEADRAIKWRAQTLLGNRQVQAIGSDAHRLDHRPPRLSEGVRYIYASVDEDYADRLLRGEILPL